MAPMERSSMRQRGAEVGHVNTMWSIPTAQLHRRHCVGRILPVPMYQISDATFVTGIVRTRFHVTSDQSGCFIKCDNTHFGESRISDREKCHTPHDVNSSWISGDGKIAQLHALLSLPSTTRECPSRVTVPLHSHSCGRGRQHCLHRPLLPGGSNCRRWCTSWANTGPTGG